MGMQMHLRTSRSKLSLTRRHRQCLTRSVPQAETFQLLTKLRRRNKIMEYLKIVKNKISQMEVKLGDAQNEAEIYKSRSIELEAQLRYYKTKSQEFENSREKVIEKEKVMAMKYGIILSQNKELVNKCKILKTENDDLRAQLHEHSKKESISDIISNDLQSKLMNMTTRNHKRDYSSPIIHKNNPTCHSSATLSNNCNEFDKMNRSTAKNIDKSSDFDPISSTKGDQTGIKLPPDDEESSSEPTDFTSLKKLIAIQQSSLESLPSDQKSIVSHLINKLLTKEKQRLSLESQCDEP